MPTAVLLIWPVIAMGLFAALGPARGLIWACGIGYLFLPEFDAFPLPGLPDYGKRVALALALLLGILVSASKAPPKPEVQDKTVRIIVTALLVMIFVGILGTIMDNRYPLIRGERFQAAHSLRDMVRLSTEVLVTITAFLLARRWLADPKHHVDILKALAILGLVYSFLVLFEARMSPQLNRWVYDFFPHAWLQHIRGGGFRPIVFLSHGLAVGMFLFMSVIAAFVLFRQISDKNRMIYLIMGVWLLLVLMVSRNLGATMQALLFAPLVLLLGRRWQLWAATAVAILFISYPMSRASLPTDRFVATIATFAPERAESLAFRLKHEDQLLERALEKPIFGWGGWGRSRVVDEKGRDQSVTDGFWIIRLGIHGWVGYVAFFGLIAAPIYFLGRRRNASHATVGLGVIMAGALFYSIPNAEMNVMTWLMAGAVAGYLQYSARDGTEAAENMSETPVLDTRQTAYTRFAHKVRSTSPTPYSRKF